MREAELVSLTGVGPGGLVLVLRKATHLKLCGKHLLNLMALTEENIKLRGHGNMNKYTVLNSQTNEK